MSSSNAGDRRAEVGGNVKESTFTLGDRNVTIQQIAKVDAGSHEEGKAIWNVPFPRNPNFTGREDLLQALEEALQAGETTAVTQAVHGLGGIGKTQLVVEFAYRNHDRYQAVLWVDSEGPAVLDGSFAGLAEVIGLPAMTEQQQAVQTVRKWLTERDAWLLIFDNATDAAALRDYLPASPGGHVLITSRNSQWGQTARSLDVPTLPRPESVAMLLTQSGQRDDPETTQAADRIAETLGDLPLALAQAIGYVTSTGISLGEYLELFQTRRGELWGEEVALRDDQRTVATTWSVALDQLSEGAAGLFNLCAFLSAEPIPRSLLQGDVADLPQPVAAIFQDALALNRTVQELRRFSLLDATGEHLIVHRLVQTVVRDRLKSDDRRRWSAAALQVMRAGFQYDDSDPRKSMELEPLVPHVLAVVASAGEVSAAPQSRSALLNDVALVFRHRGRFAEARTLLQKAIAIDEAAYEADHPTLAVRYSNLASVEQDLGNLTEARTLLQKAIAIDKAAYEADHPTLAVRYSNLASVEKDLGNLTDARALLQKAIAIDEAAYEANHPTLAVRYSNLATVEHDLGNLADARALLQEAIAIDEAAYEANHPTLAVRYSNLALVEKDLGNLTDARTLLQKAIAIDEAAYEANHPTLAVRYSNLALVEQDLGNLTDARALLQKAIAIDEAAYKPDHPLLALRYSNLALVERDLGNLADARELLRKAIEIQKSAYGLDHFALSISYSNLATVENGLGNFAETLQLMRKAFDIRIARLGPAHADTQATINWLRDNDPDFKMPEDS